MSLRKNSKKEAAKKKPQKEIMVLFSREGDLDKNRLAVTDCFGLEAAESGNSVVIGNENCDVSISILLPSMGKDEKKFIESQKSAVCGFFSKIEDCNEDIKINLCHHIQQTRAYIYIEVEAKDSLADLEGDVEMVQDIMWDVAEAMEGVLIVEQGTVALGVVDKEPVVILAGDGSSDLDAYFPFVLEENPKFLAECTEKQKARRRKNMQYLFDKVIYVCELPLNEDEDTAVIRGKEEVVRRALGLMTVALYSESMLNPEDNLRVEEAREFIDQVKDSYGIENLEEILSPDELAYIRNDNPDEMTKIQYSWQYENLYVMEWVLGLAEWNDPVEICDVSLMVRNMKEFHSIEDICAKTTMRSSAEILDKADLIYRMDWAAVDARIHRMSGPGGLEHGVVQERHKALNWMINFGGAAWDDVDTPT